MPAPPIRFEPSTSYEDALTKAAGECGILPEYWDIFQKKHEASPEVQGRILKSLGWDVSSTEAIDQERAKRFEASVTSALPTTLVIGDTYRSVPVNLPASSPAAICFETQLEDGQRLTGSIDTSQLRLIRQAVVGDRLWSAFELPIPAEVPLGYHTLTVTVDGTFAGRSNLIVCPDRAYLPKQIADGGRTAGFNVALYGLRSDRNWGCGDFTDLRALIEWARNEIGFSFIGVNPLHALHNRVPYNTSPYLPLSIFYKNLIYIDIESIPEFQACSSATQMFHSPRLQEMLRKLRAAEFVEYEQVDRLKRRFLKLLFRQFRRGRDAARTKAFAEYSDREGELLQKFALYCALDEVLHKQDRNRWTWREWPPEYQSPESEACLQFAKQHSRTVDFYKYVQFVLEEQLCEAQTFAKDCGMPIRLYHDLAFATDSSGSDLWAHRELFVNGCRVGAPPDDFSPNGQDWSFPPPNSAAHRDNGYQLYRDSIRKIARHGGALRIDHVMRLFRLFWIPEGTEPKAGTYVRENASDLMRILALESVRSKIIVVGEDLGTVTDEIRDTLSRFGILSYRLFYFEKHPKDKSFKASEEYPRQALIASTTHDLPTIAGFWTFRDIEARKDAGLVDEAAFREQMKVRQREKQRMLEALHEADLLPHYYPRNAEQVPELTGELHNAIIGFLAQAPSMIFLVNQEDFTKETEQQNLPASVEQYPNWRRKMRVKIEELGSPSMQPFTAMFRDQLTRTDRRVY